MDHGLSAAERERYRERGFLVRRAVLEPDQLETLRAAVERIHGRVARAAASSPEPVERIDGKRYQRLLESTVKWEWAEGSRAIRSMEPFAHLDPRADALIDEPRLWHPARDLVGGAVDLFTDKLNFKRPRGSPFPWHQDTPYWAFGCGHVDRLASVQVYLDDASRDNGCLWIVPGSHRGGVLPVYRDRGVLGRLYTDEDQIDPSRAEPIEAPAGSAIFFHGDVVHGSQGNRTQSSRRAVVLTYQPAGHPRWNRPDRRPVRLH